MSGGRPTDYKKEYAQSVKGHCLLGATDEDLAEIYGVCVATISNWKNQHPEFLDALKEGKERADAKVAESLYNTAIEGNTTAQIFWLKNRKAIKWRDKQEIDHQSSDGSMSPTKIEIVAPDSTKEPEQ